MFVEPRLGPQMPLTLYEGCSEMCDGCTSAEEMQHLEKNEGKALQKALAKEKLAATTQDFPKFLAEEDAVCMLGDIRSGRIAMWHPIARKVNPAVGKGVPGNSDIHIASVPGSDPKAYNNVALPCIEDGISLGVVW